MTPLRILVVDDVEDSAVSLAFLLGHCGHTTATATDPRHAVSVARTFNPHVAVLDIGMPAFNGWELAGMLRTSHPGLALFAVSGYCSEADIRKSEAAGFLNHFAKPLDFSLLEDALGRVVPAPRTD